tara:strand:+ start:561 stop:1295 length:735 start_codon:yes stop_codon:yes gene_type:complete
MKNKKLKNKRKIAWLTSSNEQICEIFCKYKFDIICVDLEHSQISLSECIKLLRIIQYNNKLAFIRLTNKKMTDLNRYLDFGVDGIIVPDIKNKIECENIIKRIYYPPIGERGVGLHRANNFGDNFEKYFNTTSKKLEFISIIESKKAVENLDEILSVPDLDGIMIGPYDLSASLGVPGKFTSSIFKKSINNIKIKAKKFNKQLGIHVVQPEKKVISQYLKKEFNFVVCSLDTLLLKKSIEDMLE